MSFFERVPSPKTADEIRGGEHKDDFANSRIQAPLAESDFFKGPEIETMYDKVAAAIAATSDTHKLKHIETCPDVTTIPVDQDPMPVDHDPAPLSKSSKKNSQLRRKGIVIGAMLCLTTGIVIGGFTQNLKAINLRGAEQAAPQPAVVDATGPKLSEIADQLVAIASDLSSVHQKIKELAAAQEQIRKAQEQLAQTQSRFAALQAQANLKQNMQPTPHTPEGRKPNRRDIHFPFSSRR